MTLPPPKLAHDVPLAPYTTLGLGGPARYFLSARTVEEVGQALAWAQRERVAVHVLGGGSNTIFLDEGFPGLVLHVALRGLSFREEGGCVYATAAAGEPWDEFIGACVERGLAGLECLSGIPGSVGAAPVQNVGAYGQEVSETMHALTALYRGRPQEAHFGGAECRFAYRQSRFKGVDRGRYVITSVTFCLVPEGRPQVRYAELQRYLEERMDLAALERGRPALEAVREAVLALRRSKSMVVDPTDPHSRSVGSFFLNPVLSAEDTQRLEARWLQGGGSEPMPRFSSPEGIKVPAAWLVEQAGFHRGYRRGGVGISAHHCLALVNYGGTARELLELAREVQEGVQARFGVWLEMEPEVIRGA
jgi:UDP-N-acetylmuramate dehydrogenase